MATAMLCTGLLGLLVFGLGFAVSMTRAKTETIIGTNSDPTDRLYKMVRAHGNATEYAPILAVLMVVVAMAGEPVTWVVWVMIVVTALRYVHAAGMIAFPTLDKPNPLRFIGSVGTYVGGLALCVALFLAG
jgi:uncharacterized membrane protein YecN with MAPEG domain